MTAEDWLFESPSPRDADDRDATERELRRRERQGRRRPSEGGRGRGRRALAVLTIGAVALAIVVAGLGSTGTSIAPRPPRSSRRRHGDDPRGLQPASGREIVKQDGLRGSYMAASCAPPSRPGRYGGAHPKSLEGFLFPATFDLRRHAPVPNSSGTSSRTSSAGQGRRHALRPLQEPHRLRRAHDRLDDRARGPGTVRPQAGRGGDLQPPARQGCSWASTRRSASRPATTRGR